MLQRVDIDDADGVDFLLATGTDVINRADGSVVEMDTKTTGVVTDELKAIFAAGVERGLPLLVANPDTIYAGPNGYTAFCPGLLGTLYESMGGTVTYYGKPHAEHFQLCLDMLGLDLAEVFVGKPKGRGVVGNVVRVLVGCVKFAVCLVWAVDDV